MYDKLKHDLLDRIVSLNMLCSRLEILTYLYSTFFGHVVSCFERVSFLVFRTGHDTFETQYTSRVSCLGVSGSHIVFRCAVLCFKHVSCSQHDTTCLKHNTHVSIYVSCHVNTLKFLDVPCRIVPKMNTTCLMTQHNLINRVLTCHARLTSN